MCHDDGVRRRPVTIQDVAREARVSTATVSRVLNGAPSVDPELARRVRDAVSETDYVLNTNGRALRRQVSDVWAAIVSDVENSFFTTMVSALQSVAVHHGYSVMLCNTDEEVSRERDYVQAAIAQQMAGVVVAAASESESDLTPLQAAQIATVVVDRRIEGHSGDSILVDNRRAGRLVAEHLVDVGYRKIACIGGPPDVSTTEDRLLGFREALAEAGRPLSEEFLLRANLRAEGGERAMAQLLDAPEQPDAVFVTNGPLTAGAFRAVQAHDLRMPEDIALVGVDDDFWTRMVTPMVTVVQQPVAQMGELAAELLLSRAVERRTEERHLILQPQLAVRGSSVTRA